MAHGRNLLSARLVECNRPTENGRNYSIQSLRYDPDQVKLEDVLTQPYDKITPEMQSKYYERSAHNLVRIILGKAGETDTDTFNIYTRAAEYLHDWRSGGILKQDPAPGIYAYSQTFTVPGTRDLQERRGLIALGRLHDYADGVVFRHEQTLAKPRADRLNLLRATRAHFGQIFMLYSDPKDEIEALLKKKIEEDPDTSLLDEYETLHRLWRIHDPALIQTVQQRMRDKKLLIADGHHRYETALAYRNERRAESGGTDPNAPYEFVMMTLIPMESRGLVILPTHRIVHGLPTISIASACWKQPASSLKLTASICAQKAAAPLLCWDRPGKTERPLSPSPARDHILCGQRRMPCRTRWDSSLFAARSRRGATTPHYAGKGAGNF